MKKVLFVLVFVAVYGVSMAMSSSSVATIAEDAQVTFVADLDDNTVVTPEEGDKDKKKKKAKSKSKSDAKSKGCDDSKTKSSGCDGKAKADCGSACGGEKK